MFMFAEAFNQPLSFNTANVTDTAAMFTGAKAFNQQLPSFDTAKVTNMLGMFDTATAFNQPLTFDTSKVVKYDQDVLPSSSLQSAAVL